MELKKFRTWLVKYICYCGLDKDDYNSIKKEAYRCNFRLWKGLHAVILVLSLFMLVAVSIMGTGAENLVAYIILVAYGLTVTILFWFVLKEDSLGAQLLIYLTMNGMFISGLAMSMNNPQHMAVTFIVMLVLMSMFMIDKPYFMMIEIIGAAAVHLLHAYAYKSMEIARMDLYNSIVFGILGCYINVFYNSLRVRELLLQKKLIDISNTDALTGLKNKSAIMSEMGALISKHNGVMLMLDIDAFKSINDRYGHDVGDMVLKEVGTRFKQCFPEGSVMGRFGGDEFTVYMPGGNAKTAVKCAEKLRSLVSSQVHTPDYNDVICMCAGIAECAPDERNFDTLFKKADIAMYNAKNSGADKCCVYGA